MKYLSLVIVLLLPTLLVAQVERVVAPGEAGGANKAQDEARFDSQRSYFEAIMTSTSSDTTTEQEESTKSTASTSESTEASRVANENAYNETLSSLVSDINNQYKEATRSCSTGSWLENILCRIKWW